MNSVSIIINGTRYDATDMNQWTDCDKCDLHGICMVSHWWVREACSELGEQKGTVVFKKSTKTFLAMNKELYLKVLHLSLKKEWYEMIESGVKTEEYREVKPYWIERLTRYGNNTPNGRLYAEFMASSPEILKHNLERGEMSFVCYDAVRFSYGYTRRTMTFEIKEITIGRGCPEWGAPSDKDVFIIKLGKKLK